MSSQDPNLGLTYGFGLGFSTWNTEMNDNILKLGAIVGMSVLGIEQNTPPGAPAEGDRYTTGDAPTGAWAGQAQKVAIFVNAAWTFYEPQVGWVAYNQADTLLYVYTGDTGIRWGAYAMLIST